MLVPKRMCSPPNPRAMARSPAAGAARSASPPKIMKQIPITGTTLTEKVPAVTIIEVNAEPTPLTEEGISDYLIQEKTGEILPVIVEEIKKIKQVS